MQVERIFNQRTPQEKEWLLANTWCDKCQEADLGMTDPREYEENGVQYVEGKCLNCQSTVRSSIDMRNIEPNATESFDSTFMSWNLHDGVLASIQTEWETKVCKMQLSAFIDKGKDAVDCIITFDGVVDVHIPHRMPWGESFFVNRNYLKGANTFVVEMQSGDEIVITASSVTLSRLSGAP